MNSNKTINVIETFNLSICNDKTDWKSVMIFAGVITPVSVVYGICFWSANYLLKRKKQR